MIVDSNTTALHRTGKPKNRTKQQYKLVLVAFCLSLKCAKPEASECKLCNTRKRSTRDEQPERQGRAHAMGGGHGHGGHDVSYGGLSLHPPARWHSRVGQGMCAVMWFWILYRAKQDGPALLGLRHPWEGHGHGHDEHGKH